MRRAIARSAGLLACAFSMACFAGTPPKFDTLDEAARAACAEALPMSTKYEYGGVLYSLDGGYFYSQPQTSHSESSVNIRVKLPSGARLAGIYHSHPDKDAQSDTFSQDDVAVARTLKKPSYICVVKDGSTRVFETGKDVTQAVVKGHKPGAIAKGRSI